MRNLRSFDRSTTEVSRFDEVGQEEEIAPIDTVAVGAGVGAVAELALVRARVLKVVLDSRNTRGMISRSSGT